jgi:hypothetical protein
MSKSSPTTVDRQEADSRETALTVRVSCHLFGIFGILCWLGGESGVCWLLLPLYKSRSKHSVTDLGTVYMGLGYIQQMGARCYRMRSEESDLSLQSGHDSGRIRCGESRSLSTHTAWRWRHGTWCRSHTRRWLTFWLWWWRWFSTTGFGSFSSFPSSLYGFRVCEELKRDVSHRYHLLYGWYSLLRSPHHRLY